MGVFCAYVVVVPLEISRTKCTVHYMHFAVLILLTYLRKCFLHQNISKKHWNQLKKKKKKKHLSD